MRQITLGPNIRSVPFTMGRLCISTIDGSIHRSLEKSDRCVPEPVLAPSSEEKANGKPSQLLSERGKSDSEEGSSDERLVSKPFVKAGILCTLCFDSCSSKKDVGFFRIQEWFLVLCAQPQLCYAKYPLITSARITHRPSIWTLGCIEIPSIIGRKAPGTNFA